MMRTGMLGLWLVALAGCAGNQTTVFPPGLEPLEVSVAPAPGPLPGQPFPEQVRFVRGSAAGYDWANGRAYVHASLADTFRALSDPWVARDPTIHDVWIETVPDPDYAASYIVHYTVHDFITVVFDVTWRHGIVTGTAAQPTLAAGRFQKTFGTAYIRTMEGSVVARRVDDGTTELELVEHLDATNSGAADAESYLHDYFDNIIARVHGQPLHEK